MGLNKDGTVREMKEWVLDDGTTVTTEDVMAKLKCARSTAYSRLVRSTNPTYIYKGVQDTSGGKTYLLSDGSYWTVAELAEHLGCLHSTAGCRLSNTLTKGNDVAKVLKPVNGLMSVSEIKHRASKSIVKIQKARMIGDLEGHWKLFNANT
jgi:transketolase C-terminal domain/subunit